MAVLMQWIRACMAPRGGSANRLLALGFRSQYPRNALYLQCLKALRHAQGVSVQQGCEAATATRKAHGRGIRRALP